ncbi:MAG TPA: XylR family transcriptional regulator [Tepidisphaeraceae bacterium]|nr:XylR family transcriptional regulator [Tepidisphaeraceae bacterium]
MTNLKDARRASDSPPSTGKPKHVAIIVGLGFSPVTEMLRGIADYVQEHDPWAIYLKQYGSEAPPNWFRDWQGDGIMVYSPRVRDEELRECRVPIVDLAGHLNTKGIPLVCLHNEAIGRVGAEHLLDRGFKHFAFYDNIEFEWSRGRREAFVAALKARGLPCAIYSTRLQINHIGAAQGWEKQQQELAQWLKDSLPKPAGVMASSDLMGQNLLEACLLAGISVPEEIAVLGVDNDETICRIASPPMSSVMANHVARGYVAAEVLDHLMQGKPGPTEAVLIEPAGIAPRASTDMMAIEDPDVVRALQVIRERAYTNVGINDIVGSIAVSRTVLQRRFRKLVGRSIHEEIIRLRLNRAIELLHDTTLEIKAIARKSGFKSQAYMTAVFQQRLGRTPGSYRTHVKSLA